MGDYIHLFADETERTQYERSAQYNEPYASATDDTFDAEYNKRQDKQYAVKYTDTETNIRDFTYVEYDAEIEYLESTGTQYINLDFGFDKTDEVYTRFAILTTTNDKYINSPITWNNNNNRFGMGYHNGGYCVGYGNVGTTSTLMSPKTANDKQIHNWEYKNYIFKIVDLNLTRNVSSITFGGTTKNLRLFYGYNAATQAKIASYKHIKNGQPVIDLIPVRIGNTGYMYDKVSCKLFGNSGSGNFILGPDKYDAEIEYLESTGTQWINTGFIPNDSSGVYVRAYCKTSGGNHTVVGTRQSSGETRWWINFSKGIEISWNTYIAYTYSYTNTWVEVENNFLNSRLGKIDGVTKRTTYPTLASITYPVYIFTANLYGSLNTYPYTGRVSSVKISQGNEVVMDLIPVRVGNVGYMYDRVSGRLFGNAGLGQFVLGPDV